MVQAILSEKPEPEDIPSGPRLTPDMCVSEHQCISKRREDNKYHICEAEPAFSRVVRILLHTIKRAQENCSDRSFYVGVSRHITERD